MNDRFGDQLINHDYMKHIDSNGMQTCSSSHYDELPIQCGYLNVLIPAHSYQDCSLCQPPDLPSPALFQPFKSDAPNRIFSRNMTVYVNNSSRFMTSSFSSLPHLSQLSF
ncbi:hypothetical protein ACOME3_010665 [Neoechinorhynchus agilis]